MRKVLIIHPDLKLHELYKREASKFFNVDSAYDGLEGLRLIKQTQPNLILSDYHLPIISGSSLLSFVRNHSQLQSIPFVFISANLPEPESLGLGASDWLVSSQTGIDDFIATCHRHLKLNSLIYV